MRPLVLLSNDDGFDSPGLLALAEALRERAEVVVVAPRYEQSAMSHALSLHRPLRAQELPWPGAGGATVRRFAVDGTPADCVYLALHAETRFLPRRPDVVLSGINRGLNLGQDAFYSGTVAAAREASLRGVSALALSAASYDNLNEVAALGATLAERLWTTPPAKPSLFGLNVPARWNGALHVTQLGQRLYDAHVEVRDDPRGQSYFWLGGAGVVHEDHPGTDTYAHDRGFATLSALQLDLSYPAGDAMAQQLAEGLPKEPR